VLVGPAPPADLAPDVTVVAAAPGSPAADRALLIRPDGYVADSSPGSTPSDLRRLLSRVV
jgi:hypothetical protein